LTALLLMSLGTGPGSADHPSPSFRIQGGAHTPTDSRLRDLYTWIPEAGLVVEATDLGWGRVEVGALIRWASGRPGAGPFVDDTESNWLAVPTFLSLRRGFGAAPVVPFARLGFLAQWSRESFSTEVGGDRVQRSSSQLGPGLMLGGGIESRGRGLRWHAELSWQLVLGDRVAVGDSGSRRIERMDLGGFSFHFGLGFR
jgi:hypothetical protein